MKPVTTATRSATGRIIEFKMSGLYNEAAMIEAAAMIRRETDAQEGKHHIVVADMRGMKTIHPAIVKYMGEAIRYQRERGCVLCVHVSDDTVQRLQAARIAREYSPQDDVTVDAESIEHARKIAKSYELYLDDPQYQHSIREALSTTSA